MRIIILAALFACAMASMAPRWPRMPLDLLLSGKFPQVTQQDDKIVGGAEVTPHSLPFQIVLERCTFGSCSLSCGGSILSENVILNAAHCVDGVQASSLQVIAGEHDRSKDEGTEQTVKVQRIAEHADYRPLTVENDISLIFLSTPLTLNSNVQPIALPTEQDAQTPDGKPLIVSGWGTTRAGGIVSQVLRSVDVPAVSDASCRSSYGENRIKDSMLCAGLPEGGKDSCQGDSGGPLFAEEPTRGFVQYGIVSWGSGCADPGFPGVYTEISFFLDWIRQNGGPA